MQRRKAAPPRKEIIDAQRWQTVLNNRIPLAGGWLRRQSAEMLVKLCHNGDPSAARILACAVDNHADAGLREYIRQELSNRLPGAALDAAWDVWVETRKPGIGEILKTQNRAASTPPTARVLSALVLQQENILQNCGPEMVKPIVDFCADSDPLVSSRARFALTQLKVPASVSALCGLWAANRAALLENAMIQAAYLPQQPPELRALVALKTNRLEVLTKGEAGVVAALLANLNDRDPEITARARFCLLNLQETSAINELCVNWVKDRHPVLGESIVQACLVASRPPRTRLFSALKAGKLEIAEKVTPDGLSFLLEAAADKDPIVAANAEIALKNMRLTETIDAFCRAVVEHDNPLAKRICAECGYLPSLPEQRALFFFLTDQWTAYETLDFDQKLLNAIYEASGLDLRQKILRKLQQAGRTDYLSILTGGDSRVRAAKMTPIESELLVRVLSGNREWARLWGLVFELALTSSVDIVRILLKENWRPENPPECEIFESLAALTRSEILLPGPSLAAVLPAAVARSTLRLNGRINDAAFAPNAPLLAIGTGARRLALWNFRKAEIDRVYRGFDHSIGQIAFSSGGRLYCAEKTTRPDPCAVYRLAGDELQVLGSHMGSITTLECLDEDRLFTTGRDQAFSIWDGEQPRRVAHVPNGGVQDWPRAAVVSPDRTLAAVLYSFGPLLYSLPSLDRVSLSQGMPWARFGKSIPRSAAFLANNQDLLLGKNNGEVYLYEATTTRYKARKVFQHKGSAVGMACLPERQVAATGGAEGEVFFFRLPDFSVIGKIEVPGERLSSLSISPDGSFMATGTSESSTVLWDLRVMDIPALFNQPVASILPNQVAAVNSMADYADLPDGLRNSLHFLRTLLMYKFRYDIEVGEVALIQAGEFDVLID